ncbi:hypothetical protein [Fortiea contorta]|uniref:hypothetical protein n=1 Tax=Fortiea contorta TaxID=1892405 RepID=UPI00034BDADF|nr:hypothetical protein [Fortiea contorta]
MNLTSEQVHWIGGVAFTIVAVLLILYKTRVIRAGWLSYLLPLLLIGYGVESLIDPLVHGTAKPQNYGAESLQHIIQGTLMLIVGGVEWLRAGGQLKHYGWGLLLPLGLIGVGGVFMFHAQHEANVPPLLLLVQHRIFAITLWITAAAKALAEWPNKNSQAFSIAWLLPLLLFGLELLVYSEGGNSSTHSIH